jgi:hypothetical protein
VSTKHITATIGQNRQCKKNTGVVDFYKDIIAVETEFGEKESIILEVPAEYAETIKQIIAELRAEKIFRIKFQKILKN